MIGVVRSHQRIVENQATRINEINSVVHIPIPSNRRKMKQQTEIRTPPKNEATLPPPSRRESAAVQSKPAHQEKAEPPTSGKAVPSSAWAEVLQRAKTMRDSCRSADDHFASFDSRYEMTWGKDNMTLATLPAFGIIDALEEFQNNPTTDDKWQCVMPPETQCDAEQLTVVFMAYNPDRLGITLKEIRKLLSRENFQGIIKECVLVWNGPRSVDESAEGRELLEFAKQNALRVEYPLKMGFPNDLMNRYHPDVVKPTTAALLYYDDDGPFYGYKAIEGGFELWKRHARAQVGAMSRQINYSPRQAKERSALDPQPNDKLFVSHCDNLDDKVEYNFYYFANYDANMVLPSGSMLHSNYLCFLWHPVLEPIRKFVLAHPVHPDDITVSTVVSHLAGRAPRVYSRRLNPQDGKTQVSLAATKRRLAEEETEEEKPKEKKGGIGGICWDCGSGMTEKKQIWADLRSQAINTLIRYFGSINSGSIGWCEGTEFYTPDKKDGKCKPVMARQGWLNWMKPDGTRKETCP